MKQKKKKRTSKQMELFPILCPCEDDRGVVCNTPITRKQFQQDGMCWDCADRLWDWYTKIGKSDEDPGFFHPVPLAN